MDVTPSSEEWRQHNACRGRPLGALRSVSFPDEPLGEHFNEHFGEHFDEHFDERPDMAFTPIARSSPSASFLLWGLPGLVS